MESTEPMSILSNARVLLDVYRLILNVLISESHFYPVLYYGLFACIPSN